MQLGMLAAVAMTAGALSMSSAAAQSDNLPAEGASESAIVVHMRGPPTTRAQASAALLAKAQATGQVRVFVELPLALQDEDKISPEQATSQAQALRTIQDELLTRVVGAAPATNTNRVVRYTFIPFVSILVDADRLSRLLADPEVVSIVEDTPKFLKLDQSVPLIDADRVWLKPPGILGTGYSIAVLDTGVESTHSMLNNKVVSEACYSGNEAPKYTSLCPGGKDFVVGPGSGKPCSMADCDHGTHVASIAAGRTERFGSATIRKLTGVAPGANIVAIQVFRKRRAADCPDKKAPCLASSDTDIISGIQRAYELRTRHKVAVVNLSLGGLKSSGFCDYDAPHYFLAFDKLLNAGILATVASGNEKYNGFMTLPACISKAVAVGATDKSDFNYADGNKAHQLKLLAPGVDITAAVPGNKAASMTGTSMAAPHVAGAIALLRQARPKARADEILAALACGGTDIGIFDYAKPRINVLGAHKFLTRPPTVQKVFNFETASEGNSWQPLLGAWSVSGGNYQPAAGGTVSNVSLLKQDRCNGSVTIEARIKRANAGGGAYGFEGFIYKATIGIGSSKLASGYLAFFTNNNGNNDFAGIVRLTNFKLTDPFSFNANSFVAICYDNTPNQKFGDYNTLKVVTQGGKHILFLNGSKACETFDFGYFGGDVAVFSAPLYNAGDVAAFDYITIKPTDRAVPN